MSTAAAAAEGGYEGSVGGKLRARQPRRAPATPYDRPPAAARGLRGNRVDVAEAGRGSGWISKLVDPASTLITKGASRLLSSVFRRRPGALPPEESPVASFESGQLVPDASDNNHLPVIQEQGSEYEDDSRKHPNVGDISELEQLLNQKTFTRAEYDRLMELLRSRTVDAPKEDENKRIEPCTLLAARGYRKQEDENLPPQESRIESSKYIGIISTPGPMLKIPEEQLDSPAEVAKAYMGSRSSKVSPSSLSLRGQMLREAIASPTFIGFTRKSSVAPICSKSAVRFSGVPRTLENGYMTPRLRGRSSIYKMSRSPYFKGQPTVILKAGEPVDGGYPGPSMSTEGTPMNGALSTGRQVLKRSCVLESDMGHTGPIRRIRQKSDFVPSSEDIISQFPGKFLPAANALDIIQRSSSIQRSLPFHEHKYDTSSMKKKENLEERSGYTSVPLQSREMAEKILQQLDKLVPSPKADSTESKKNSRDESPCKFTLDMRHGEALKDVAERDESKLFNVEGNGKLEGSNNFHTSSHRSSISPVEVMVENAPSKPFFPQTKIVSEAKGVGGVVTTITETGPVKGSVNSVLLHSAVRPLLKAPGFKMEAPEGSLGQEDDSYRRDFSRLSASGKEKVEINDDKSAIFETAVIKKTFAFSSGRMPNSATELIEVAGKGVSDGSTVADKDTDSVSQVSSPLSIRCQASLTPAMPSLPVGESVPSGGQNAMPLFTFGSKSTPLIFSSRIMSSTHAIDQKFEARSDFKGQSFGSSSTTITTTTAVERTGSAEDEKTQKAGDLHKSVGTSSSFGLSMPPTSSNFQFVASATSGRSNGSLTTKSSIFSVSCASAASLSGSSASTFVSADLGTVSSSSSESYNSVASTALPSFQFGAGSPASGSTGLESKLFKESPFGIASSAAAAAKTFSSTGSSTFGFSASASSNATVSSSAGLVFSSQAAQSANGTSCFAGRTASQFGSAAAPNFGLAGSSFGVGSSVFGSSISSVTPGYGPSSTLSSPAAPCSYTPSSSCFEPTVTAPSVFGSSSQTTGSSVGFGFGSSACSPSASTFGLSSATSASTSGAASASSASTSFGSSSKSPFSVSSSAATSSAFSFTQAITTSSSAFPFTFGATMASVPLSPAVSVSPGNDQISVEDGMADDMVQAPIPVIPTFGQSSVPTPSLPFSSPPTPGAPIFQFSSSQSSTFPQSRTPFQSTGSFEFGGNFSMGSGGDDKSGRRFIKAKRDKHRKK